MAKLPIYPSDDAYIAEYYGNGNFGKDENLYTGNFMQAHDVYRSLLKFDLSAIPIGSTITSATLKLYVIKKDNAALPNQMIAAYQNINDFSETTVTWNNAPRVDQTVAYPGILPDTIPDAGHYIDIDVLDLVKSWFDKSKANYGITVVARYEDTINSIIRYKSKEYSDNNKKPVLEINYNQFTVGKLYQAAVGNDLTLSTTDAVIAALVSPAISDIASGQKVKIDYAFDLAFTAGISAANSSITATVSLYKEETGGTPIASKKFQMDFPVITLSNLTPSLPVSGTFSTVTASDGQPYYLRVVLSSTSASITVPKANNVVLQVLTVQ
jgi:hypothetical protein